VQKFWYQGNFYLGNTILCLIWCQKIPENYHGGQVRLNLCRFDQFIGETNWLLHEYGITFCKNWRHFWIRRVWVVHKNVIWKPKLHTVQEIFILSGNFWVFFGKFTSFFIKIKKTIIFLSCNLVKSCLLLSHCPQIYEVMFVMGSVCCIGHFGLASVVCGQSDWTDLNPLAPNFFSDWYFFFNKHYCFWLLRWLIYNFCAVSRIWNWNFTRFVKIYHFCNLLFFSSSKQFFWFFLLWLCRYLL